MLSACASSQLFSEGAIAVAHSYEDPKAFAMDTAGNLGDASAKAMAACETKLKLAGKSAGSCRPVRTLETPGYNCVALAKMQPAEGADPSIRRDFDAGAGSGRTIEEAEREALEHCDAPSCRIVAKKCLK
jgi:hypothetical protein